jgi:sugar phosphate isomerase/epimerase
VNHSTAEKEKLSMISRREFLISVPLSAALPALARAASGPSNRVACQANAWQIKPGDFPELLKRAGDMKRLGYEGFECNVRFVEGEFARAKQARAQIEETGMAFFGPHTGLAQPAEHLDQLVEGAASLGAKHFAVSGANKSLTKEGKLDQTLVRTKIEDLSRLGKRCKTAGLQLVYHNHQAEFVAGGLETEALLKGTDPELVFLLVDLGHAFRAGADLVPFFARHYPRIAAMHLRDIRGKKQVTLGEGELDYAGLAAFVRKTGWPGWLTVEVENLSNSLEGAKLDSRLEADRRAIRKFFGV